MVLQVSPGSSCKFLPLGGAGPEVGGVTRDGVIKAREKAYLAAEPTSTRSFSTPR
tara:strand:+ start:15838 stop:16002 length:165 start_codon:yes stop_codon:yes gene_type:complete